MNKPPYRKLLTLAVSPILIAVLLTQFDPGQSAVKPTVQSVTIARRIDAEEQTTGNSTKILFTVNQSDTKTGELTQIYLAEKAQILQEGLSIATRGKTNAKLHSTAYEFDASDSTIVIVKAKLKPRTRYELLVISENQERSSEIRRFRTSKELGEIVNLDPVTLSPRRKRTGVIESASGEPIENAILLICSDDGFLNSIEKLIHGYAENQQILSDFQFSDKPSEAGEGERKDSDESYLDTYPLDVPLVEMTHSDEKGKFSIPRSIRLENQETKVIVFHPDYQAEVRSIKALTRKIKLVERRELSVQVTDSEGNKVSGATVVIAPDSNKISPTTLTTTIDNQRIVSNYHAYDDSAMPGLEPAFLETDDEGLAQFEQSEIARGTVFVFTKQHGIAKAQFDLDKSTSVNIKLCPVGKIAIDTDIASLSLAELKATAVYKDNPDFRISWTGKVFQISGLPVGSITGSYVRGDRPVYTFKGTIQAGKFTDLELEPVELKQQ